MKIIGISGGSGAGKSTVSRIMSEKLSNSLLINGDVFMHEESKKLENDILREIGIEKDENIFSYNYYLESFENVKTWVKVMENNVISKIEDMIIHKGKDKEYIVVDWVFLPLCEFFKKCDYTLCVKTDYDKRLVRLTKRLQDKTIYNEGDRSYWSYKPGIIEKRLEYTALNEKGYCSDYEICNNGNMEQLNMDVERFLKNVISIKGEYKDAYKL